MAPFFLRGFIRCSSLKDISIPAPLRPATEALVLAEPTMKRQQNLESV